MDADAEENVYVVRKEKRRALWTPFSKQLLIASTAWVMNFLHGLHSGLPTVMIPQLRQEANSSKETISEEMFSWIYSINGYSALPWIVIVCISTHFLGRKIPYTFVCFNNFATFAVLYFSKNVYHILIAQIMHGVTQACNTSLNIIVILEYVSPKYRGIFIATKAANFFWGVWISNALGTFCYWKYVPLLGMILSTYYVTVIFWPESPQWLATVQKFEKCRKEHRWLRGTDEQSEKELKELIQSQIDYRNVRKDAHNLMKNIKGVICHNAFYKPMLLAILIMAQYHFTGKMVITVFALDIIKKITNSDDAAYIGMLILDAVTIAALYIGCILSKILRRRTLLLPSTFIGVTLLFVISLYNYLIESQFVSECKIVSLVLLTLFSVFIGLGPMIMLTPIAGELTPLRFQTSITILFSLGFAVSLSTSLKIFPLLCERFNLSGTFLFYAVGSMVCCLFLYVYLPETKDKTLQEIENIYIKKQDRTRERHAFVE